VRALLRRLAPRCVPRVAVDTSSDEELRASLRTALRAQSTLPLDTQSLLVDCAVQVACDAWEEPVRPEDVVRGLLRWHSLTGLPPDVLAHYATPAFLSTPAETIVSFVFLLRELLPNADLTRVFAALPMGALLRDEGVGEEGVRLTSLRYCAQDALAELRQFMPEAIVQLLAEEAPTLLFGELSIANSAQLRDAWLASGSALLSEAELATAMRDKRFIRYFVNFVM
jgi:hypothetical protein